MILNTPPQAGVYKLCTKLVIKMYLILSDVNDNVTPEVFYDGVYMIGLRVVGEEKGRWKRSYEEDLTRKIHQRRSD